MLEQTSLMMKKNFYTYVLVVVIAALAGCASTPNNAPIVDRNQRDAAPANLPSTQVEVKPAAKPAIEAQATYVVKRGDTLYRIGLDHGQSHNDLALWNNLKNVDDIKVGQVLKVSPPEAIGGVQTGAVTNGGAVEIKSISSVSPATNKSLPRGDKKPYSEANLAELQKPEPSSTASAIAVSKPEAGTATKTTEKPAEKPAEKPVASTASTPAAEQESVEWIWPTEGKVIASFDDSKNKGIDIAGKPGQDIFAAGPGKVMYEGSGIRGYGNLVIIKHTNTPFLSAYAHNKVNLVKEGQTIVKGQKIAEMGNSDTEVTKLHFEIRQQGKPVDPAKFLPSR